MYPIIMVCGTPWVFVNAGADSPHSLLIKMLAQVAKKCKFLTPGLNQVHVVTTKHFYKNANYVEQCTNLFQDSL